MVTCELGDDPVVVAIGSSAGVGTRDLTPFGGRGGGGPGCRHPVSSPAALVISLGITTLSSGGLRPGLPGLGLRVFGRD
jgi:hypothetical protein